MTPPVAVILGIRPDVIRASLILERLQGARDVPVVFIWSGQHYSDNLKDVFFRELRVRAPDVELGASAEGDADIVAKLLPALSATLAELKPQAAVFLGDTNTVLGAIVPGQLNIPIVHIEGCMRSYDWRMPEEKYRTIADHLSDVIYAYLEEYRAQGVAEGLDPDRIIVTGNPIVDVLDRYYFDRLDHFEARRTAQFFRARDIEPGEYCVMTCHRRENVHDLAALTRILALVRAIERRVYFAASYRTQRVIREHRLQVPENLTIVDPIGYEEFLLLMTSAWAVLTDSGTVVEEACILHVPAVQMRRSTERPQVYDVGACVKFDPTNPDPSAAEVAVAKLNGVQARRWDQPFGDGRASQRIADDLLARARGHGFDRHRPEDYHLDVRRAYRPDGLK